LRKMADEGGFEGQMSLLGSVMGRRTIHILKMEAFEVPVKQNRRSTSHSEFLEINRSHPLHKMVWFVRYPYEQPQLAHTALS
jgi:hypothetical protein